MTKPVNILFTIPNFVTAGSGRALLNIVERLDRDRFAPTICVLKSGGKLEDEIRAQGISLLEFPFTVPARPLHQLPGLIRQAAKAFRPYGFELWHSYHYLDDYTEPLIARAAGARAWIYTKKNMSWGGRAWQVRSALAKRIVVQNETMIGQFFTGGNRQKTRLIPRGVDGAKFHPDVPPRLQIRDRLRIGADVLLIGCVANLTPNKEQSTLIRTLVNVPNAHLLLAGPVVDEGYAAHLHHLCSDLNLADRMHFLGPVEDIPALHAELDLFVLPSLNEGCPVALLEAMASGVACIATRIPGSQDIIEHKKSGLLVPPGDVKQLAGAINALISAPGDRARLGAAGHARFRKHYTIEQEVALHEELYLELLG
ncbi:MAG: glycosyltransferase [Anaerolineae bacterium]|nr:glycosyltransferase [Anaerolineae bacterium]